MDDKANFLLSVSAGILQNYIAYENGDKDNWARLSFRPKIKWSISSALAFNFSAFYQPAINAFSNYILTGAAELSQDINKKVALKLKLNDIYRSVTEAEKYNDFSSAMALSLKF